MVNSLPHGVVALWSLLEACRVGSVDEQAAAAATAAQVLQDASADCAALTLAVTDTGLSVDDAPLIAGVDTFAAAHGLWTFLRRSNVVAIGFAPNVSADDLLHWAVAVVANLPPPEWPDTVEVALRGDGSSSAEPIKALRRSVPAPPAADSRLRSVFLQHRLIGGLPHLPGVDPGLAKAVVQGVVERLLQVDGGLEPLILLQQGEALLRRSTAVAVITVLVARRAGWPNEQLADLGVAALLHDVGAVLDPDEPAPAGFRWLLARGDDDFWLRCALVARHAREPHDLDDLRGRGLPAAVAFVRVATHAAECCGDASPAEWGSAVQSGYVPAELVDVAATALAV